ncbi:MAG TPA: ParB/RepB/Spo0J family partition protein [Solirubrobacteraceae bacterium]|jgi:ParB-like chromosome segregation protein Spo0J|nr:ParB/RepB/Spo0J family partition protein [Solirubrobacteraceae bacterium]
MTVQPENRNSHVAPDLEGLQVPVGDVHPRERNPRHGKPDLIKTSLRAHGQYRPIVANRPTGEILAGNHTYQAALELGWSHIAVTWVDVDAEEATRISLVDNRLSELGSYDNEMLAELLGELPSLEATGFKQEDLDHLLKTLAPAGDASEQLGAIEYRLMVTCRDEHQQGEWLEKLQSEGLQVQALMV